MIDQFILRSHGAAKRALFGLEPFSIAALSPERTFCEKLLALRRASSRGGEFFAARVRHLYDVFQLSETARIETFVSQQKFENMLITCYKDDELNKKNSTEIGENFCECALFSSPQKTLETIESYYNELKSITFDRTLPNFKFIINTMESIGSRLKHFKFDL